MIYAPTRTQVEKYVDEFNQLLPVGSPVTYFSVMWEGDGVRGSVLSPAFVGESGKAVVFLRGVRGYVSILHIAEFGKFLLSQEGRRRLEERLRELYARA